VVVRFLLFFAGWAIDRETWAWFAWIMSIALLLVLLAAQLSYEEKARRESDSACVNPRLLKIEPGCEPYSAAYTYQCDSGRLYVTDTMLR